MTPEKITRFDRIMADGRERTAGELSEQIDVCQQVMGHYVASSGKYEKGHIRIGKGRIATYRLKSNVAA